MRRLKRAHQKYAREQAKRHKKFRQRAVAAGTAAAITLGAGVSINKALAAYTPDPHELSVSQDADADLLANKEELAIGYRVFDADQNRSEIPDGVELAKRCANVFNQLPDCNEADPNEICKGLANQYGLEICDICGEVVNMGGAWVTNPRLGLTVHFPIVAIHYMEHGSFSYAGNVHGEDRLDIPALLRALELRFPYDPNEHQLPLENLAPDANDLDGDLLADSEELEAGYNLHDPDQDNDLTPDGIELAKQCVAAIDELQVHDPHSGGSPPDETYKINFFQRGIEGCDICGALRNMGYWLVINPELELSIEVPDIVCHYMSHGSFSYAGSLHGEGRFDVPLLVKILEMPRRCGDLGTIYLPGDLNKDCKVNFADFIKFADKWLASTDPSQD
jgi:hypothetical protein